MKNSLAFNYKDIFYENRELWFEEKLSIDTNISPKDDLDNKEQRWM